MKTPTQRAIDSINRNIRNVAETFGKGSFEYEQLTADLSRFDFRMNKKGLPQLTNTPKNRRQSSTIRAKQRRNINIKRRKAIYQKRLKEYEKRGADRFENIADFIRLMKDYDDERQRIYNVQDRIDALHGMSGQISNFDFDMGRAFRDESYLQEREHALKQHEDLINRSINPENISIVYKDGAEFAIDDETGEIKFKW